MDTNKYFDYGVQSTIYNLIEYHRYLATINNPNLLNTTANQLDSSLLGLNMLTNVTHPTSFSPNLSLSTNRSSNPHSMTPNLSIPVEASNLLLPSSFSQNILARVQQKQRYKCNCDHVNYQSYSPIDTQNQIQSVMPLGSISTDESLLSSSFESSADETRMSYSGDDQTIRMNSTALLATPSTAIKVPRAIRKSIDSVAEEKPAKVQTETKQINTSVLLPKLLVRTEKIFKKYCEELRPEIRAKIFNSQKSIVQQRPVLVREQICYFCKNNGEPDYLYKSHIVRDPITNKTLCPVLRKYKCELCQASGEDSHTRSYCPLSKFIRQNCENVEAAKYFNMKVLTSQHRKKQFLLSKLERENQAIQEKIEEKEKNSRNVQPKEFLQTIRQTLV